MCVSQINSTILKSWHGTYKHFNTSTACHQVNLKGEDVDHLQVIHLFSLSTPLFPSTFQYNSTVSVNQKTAQYWTELFQ